MAQEVDGSIPGTFSLYVEVSSGINTESQFLVTLPLLCEWLLEFCFKNG